jgi:hypothetical protein
MRKTPEIDQMTALALLRVVMRAGLAFVAVLLLSHPGSGLERYSARHSDPLPGTEWAPSSCSSSVSYFNVCSGWVWVWSGFEPGERIGTIFEVDAEGCELGPHLYTSNTYVMIPIPSGYGYTGSQSIYAVDANGCLEEPPLQSQPFAPVDTGWQIYVWGTTLPESPNRFALVIETGPTPDSPLGLVSDRPSGPPGGQPDCGMCYPETRYAYSRQYGTQGAPLCPPTPIVDGVCSAEWLVVLAGYFNPVEEPVSLSQKSWSQIKALYR